MGGKSMEVVASGGRGPWLRGELCFGFIIDRNRAPPSGLPQGTLFLDPF
jgi:hypothetical protein